MKKIKLGFMQGRLSPQIRNEIQAFPFSTWKKEFKIAEEINIKIMEWTIDNFNYLKNPIMTNSGKKEINKLKEKYNIKINSITCDFLMQDTFYKKKKITKAILGHYKKSGVEIGRLLKEFRVENLKDFNLGDEINVSAFKVGDSIKVLGTSIGKGFAGHMKRHGFAGGRKSHGKNSVMRKAGSIGAGSDPSRVWKGTRMAGRMGGDSTTINNLSVIKVDVNNNLLYINGSVPGANKGLLFISK